MIKEKTTRKTNEKAEANIRKVSYRYESGGMTVEAADCFASASRIERTIQHFRHQC
ncbi:MAG: hypothetical protein RR365_11520 [Bacteroides sp.]